MTPARARALAPLPLLLLLAAPARATPAEAANTPAPAAPKSEPKQPTGPRGPGGDQLPAGPAGEVLATIEMALASNLLDVDQQPGTLPHPLEPVAPAGLDVSALPSGAWLFGATRLTRTERIPFAVALDRKTLVFDSDRDARLESTERFPVAVVAGGIAWFSVHGLVRQEADGRTHEADLPMRVGTAIAAPASQSRLDCYRVGTMKGATRTVKIGIVDRTFRGWFTHPGRDALMVDIDGDGRFDASSESTERYRLGEPFPLDGVDAVVSAIGPLGETLTIARSPKAARRIASVAIGATTPTFEAKSIDGATWTSEKLRGRWVLLDFWATWCGPCRGEIPNLKALRSAHPDVQVLGISADRARANLDTFIATQAIDWPQVFDESGAFQRTYRVASLPSSFLIGPDGRIAARDLRGPGMVAQIAKLKAAGKK